MSIILYRVTADEGICGLFSENLLDVYDDLELVKERILEDSDNAPSAGTKIYIESLDLYDIDKTVEPEDCTTIYRTYSWEPNPELGNPRDDGLPYDYYYDWMEVKSEN